MRKKRKSFPKPAILDCIKNYKLQYLIPDFTAGLTVGIVALPLAIAFGMASGVDPQQGLWTGIIAGFLIALFGGTRVQIDGPTGAFVPILLMIGITHGYGGLATATLLSGVILIIMGILRLGNLIKFIPYPVVTGFTSGAAVIIFVSQLKEFFGLKIELSPHPIEQIIAIARDLHETHLWTVLIGVMCLLIMIYWPKKWNRIPPSIVAIIVSASLVFLLKPENVATILSKFGGIPSGFPDIRMPDISIDQLRKLMGPALTLATLGAIESLLSAMVGDSMMNTKHDSNQELIGQGIANFMTPFFGGISATGGLARTATNIRAGAKTPLAGIFHALLLLLFALLAAPLANYIPLVSLSAVLLIVSFRMGDWSNFYLLFKTSRTDFAVFLVTFILTVVFDLSIAVGIGLLMACAFFVKSMEEVGQVRIVNPEDEMDSGLDSSHKTPSGVLVFRIEGAFFFGVVEKLDNVCSRLQEVPKVVVFRMRFVPAIDATGLRAMESVLEKFRRNNTHLILCGIQPQPMKLLYKSGFIDKIGLDNIRPNLAMSLEHARVVLAEIEAKEAAEKAAKLAAEAEAKAAKLAAAEQSRKDAEAKKELAQAEKMKKETEAELQAPPESDSNASSPEKKAGDDSDSSARS